MVCKGIFGIDSVAPTARRPGFMQTHATQCFEYFSISNGTLAPRGVPSGRIFNAPDTNSFHKIKTPAEHGVDCHMTVSLVHLKVLLVHSHSPSHDILPTGRAYPIKISTSKLMAVLLRLVLVQLLLALYTLS